MASDIYNKEKAVGQKAAKMAEDYVLRQIKMELTIRNKGDAMRKIKPLMEATKVRAKMGKNRLLGLNFASSKIGYIHQFGFNGVREGSTILLSASRYNQNSTQRQSHDFKIERTGMFNSIYDKSGAAEYLINELAQIRTEAVKVKIQGLLLEINSENGN